jgi:hypothetical protein
MLENIHSCQKSYLCKILSMLYDSNAFKPYIYVLFSRLFHVPHTYIYSIGSMPKSVEYHLFGQFLKLPRQFLPDMSGLWPGHIRLAGHVRVSGF